MSGHSLTLEIDGVLIPVRPDALHEWTLATDQVASGYAVTPQALRMTKQRHADELAEGTHWVVTICDTLGGEQAMIRWTKLGVVTLGFFIRSERAKRFRKLAAELICRLHEGAAAPVLSADWSRMEAMIGELSGMVRGSLEAMHALSEVARRLERVETVLEPLSESAHIQKLAAAVEAQQMWEAFLSAVAVREVKSGTSVAFTSPDLIDLGAPVDGPARKRRDIIVGRWVARFAGKTLRLTDGTEAVWFSRRSRLQREWICTRSDLGRGLRPKQGRRQTLRGKEAA